MKMLNKKKCLTYLQMFRLRKFNFLLLLVLRSDPVTHSSAFGEKFRWRVTSACHWLCGHCVLCVCPASVGPRGDAGLGSVLRHSPGLPTVFTPLW